MASAAVNGYTRLPRADQHAWFGVDDVGGCVVVSAVGEVDLATSPRFSDAVKVAVECAPRTIVDLSGVSFVDATGLQVLVQARSRVHDRRGLIALVAPAGMPRRVLEVSQLDEAFATFDLLDEAVAALCQADTNGP
ncbi:MAG TPA: STAS domain-containing protein [Nocardioidaceae bacterium]|nr:STAS domain-containing protein [Nocardioidaceae bacterium]